MGGCVEFLPLISAAGQRAKSDPQRTGKNILGMCLTPMSPYSHSRKAGNEGDVWKHAVLLAVAGTIPVGDDAVYVESHSGAPVHQLADGGEWRRGVGRVLASSLCASEYRETVLLWKQRNEYPASWLLVASQLAGRAKTVTLNMADTSDEVALACQHGNASLLAKNVRVNFSKSDGFELAINVERPTLVFLDPPFAGREREWQLLAGTCMYLRDKGVPFCAWYPYSWHTFPDWIVETTRCETWEVLWARCGSKPSQNLKGCGMLVSDEVSFLMHTVRPHLPICLRASAGNCGYDGRRDS